MSRLYARRMLTILAASASTQRFLTQLEGKVLMEEHHVRDVPSYWKNWERKDWTEDLLQEMGETGLQRSWAALRRMVSLTLLACPMTILWPLSHVSSTINTWSNAYALYAIEAAGPTFIKLIQWATTRQDLFSPEFCMYFGQLRDQTKGHSWKETLQILEEDLGTVGRLEHTNVSKDAIVTEYLQLERDPIGSGCIAQVYKGTLLKATEQYPAGTEVAVKVQHPNIWSKVCCDFYILNKVTKWLEKYSAGILDLQYLSLNDTVRQFRDCMLPQLNLELEAKHLRRFNGDFANDDRVSFPKPLASLTTPRVLTETFVTGTPIMEYVTADEKTRVDLANLGLHTTLQMIFFNDFIHGDLHVSSCNELDGNYFRLHQANTSFHLFLPLSEAGQYSGQ